MRASLFASAALLAASLASAQTTNGWKLLWSDEFNGAANTPPNPATWNYDLGAGGWGNGELETYTNSIANAFQDGNGNLVIRAIRDASGNYTSARLRTGQVSPTDAANLAWQYGKIEARIKLPYGQGVWPAFWMLGADITNTAWPGCGEIDILENFGSNIDDASTVHGTLHGPPAGSNFAGTGLTAAYSLPFQRKFTDDFHLFSIEWAQNSIALYVDGTQYNTITPAALPAGSTWVFNQPFFVILNLAIGGPTTFLGTPSPSVPFPQEMLVDYVRVYGAVTIPPATPSIAVGGVVNAASTLGAITPGALVTLYGSNLASDTESALFSNGAFQTSTASQTSVAVNGINAPLVFASPGQINFQMPWETPLAPAVVNVTVTNKGVTSAPEPVTVTAASPSAFADYTTAVAFLTVFTDGGLTAGATCALYGNGFGPANGALLDGTPANPANISAIQTASPCTLTIAGQPATVNYCGAAPYEVIDQLNFVYPAGVPASSQPAIATLTINGNTGTFLVPAPAQ